MKKLTFLLLLLITSLNTLSSQTYNSHVFYSRSVKKGDFNKGIAESKYCNDYYSFQELRGRHYVNIKGNTPLKSNRFYYLDFGAGLDYYYLSYSRKGPHPDEDYRIDSDNNIKKIPCKNRPKDSDNDGVPDSQDNCPNQAGPASNNGCPLPQGKPDLVIDTSESTSLASGEDSSSVNLETNTTHYVYLGEELQIYLKVDNKGSAGSGNSKIGYYISTTNDINKATQIKEEKFYRVPANSHQTTSSSLSYWHLSNTTGIIGEAFLHIKVDNANQLDEGRNGESNNVYSSRRLFLINEHRKSKPGRNIPRRPVFMSINNFNGTKVKEVTINSKEEEQAILNSLPKGLYIINNDKGESKKVYKKN